MADAAAVQDRLSWLRDLPLPIEQTPLAVVDLDRIHESIDLVRRSAPGSRVTYALKASYFAPVVRSMKHVGAGLSVFSELELALARRAGFAPTDIIYNGVGRDGRSLNRALAAGVQVNIESMNELRGLLRARDGNARPAAIGLRVNGAHCGDLDAALKYQVLGLPLWDVARAADLIAGSGLRINGISFHLFQNQITNDAHLSCVRSLAPALQKLAGHPSAAVEFVDVGGGFASRLETGDQRAADNFEGIEQEICGVLGAVPVFELGRFLVSDAQLVVSRVVDVRTAPAGHQIALLDATTNYLIPAPGHRFRVERVTPVVDGDQPLPVTFVDRLGSEISSQRCGRLAAGDLVVVLNCGAYTDVMKERFVYPLPDVVVVSRGNAVVNAPAGDDRDVADYHHWHAVGDQPEVVDR